MCGSIGEPDKLLEKIRARRRAAGEPITGFDPDRSVLDDPVRDRDNPTYAELVNRRFSLDNRSGLRRDLGGDGVSDEGSIDIPAGIRASIKVWLDKHSKCGGKQITYVGDYELRIGCTCGDSGG